MIFLKRVLLFGSIISYVISLILIVIGFFLPLAMPTSLGSGPGSEFPGTTQCYSCLPPQNSYEILTTTSAYTSGSVYFNTVQDLQWIIGILIALVVSTLLLAFFRRLAIVALHLLVSIGGLVMSVVMFYQTFFHVPYMMSGGYVIPGGFLVAILGSIFLLLWKDTPLAKIA